MAVAAKPRTELMQQPATGLDPVVNDASECSAADPAPPHAPRWGLACSGPGYPDVGGRSEASSAGMNTRLASSVQPRLISSSLPMLAVPGCADNASEPNAVPVVSAENRIARAVAEPSIR